MADRYMSPCAGKFHTKTNVIQSLFPTHDQDMLSDLDGYAPLPQVLQPPPRLVMGR